MAEPVLSFVTGTLRQTTTPQGLAARCATPSNSAWARKPGAAGRGSDHDRAGIPARSLSVCAAPRKAAPRVTAAPAPWSWSIEQGRHQAVNACILFMPALDGRQLLTVEHLAAADGTLHPVQQAMVDHHGSQCGFCTPGFVMSLFALRGRARERGPGGDQRGAGRQSVPLHRLSPDRRCGAGSLRRSSDSPPRGCVARGRRLPWRWRTATSRSFSPRSSDELAGLCCDHPDAVIVAGGDRCRAVGDQAAQDAAGDGVAGCGGGYPRRRAKRRTRFRSAPAATYQDALPVLEKHFPDFGAMIRRIGSRQIRNRGTIGGNIANASPIGDSPPALLALDASLVLRRGDARRTVKLDDFFTGYRTHRAGAGRVHRTHRRPDPAARRDASAATRCRSASTRTSRRSAARSGCRWRTASCATSASASAAWRPRRPAPRAVEEALIGRPWTEATIRMAQAVMDNAFSPLSDMRASAAYRRTVARNLLLKCFLETSRRGSRDAAGAGMSDRESNRTQPHDGHRQPRRRIASASPSRTTAPPSMSAAGRSISTTCRNRRACCMPTSPSARTPMRGSSPST